MWYEKVGNDYNSKSDGPAISIYIIIWLVGEDLTKAMSVFSYVMAMFDAIQYLMCQYRQF